MESKPGPASAMRYVALVEQAPEPIFLKDLQGRYVLANQSFRDLFGLTAERILGHRDEEIFSAEQARAFRDNDQKVMEGAAPVTVEEVASYTDGVTTNLVEKFPIRDEQGRVVALGGYVIDITQRKQAELALRESEERFRLFTDNGLTVAWMKDRHGRHVYVSGGLAARSGIAQAQWKGRTATEMFGQNYAAPMVDHDRLVLETSRPMEFIEELVFGEGKPQSWLVVKFPFTDRHGETFVAGVGIDISARVVMEKALRQRADHFVLPALGAKIGSYDANLRQGTVHLSSGAAQIIGVGDEPVTWTPQQWLATIHPDDLVRRNQVVRDHILGKTPTIDVQYRVRHEDGSLCWVWSLGVAQFDESGKAYRLVGAYMDVSEQRRVQEREQAQQRLTAAIAHIQHRFLADSDPGAVLDALRSALLTLTHSKIVSVAQVVHDRQNAARLSFISSANAAGGSSSEQQALAEMLEAAKDAREPLFPRPGQTRESDHGCIRSCLLIPLISADEVLAVVGLANREEGYDQALVAYLEPYLSTCTQLLDAHRVQRARQQAEEALRESEQRYRQLVELSPDAVLVHRADRIVFANRAALDLLGSESLAQLQSRNSLEFVEPAERDTLAQRTRRIITEDWVAPVMELQIHTLSGVVKAIEITSSRVSYQGRFAIQSILRDVSERKRERERQGLSRRLESLGTLAGGVAHDFNNILAAIRVNVELAKEEVRPDAGASRFLQQIEIASERATALVRQILSFSRASTERHERVALAMVVDEVLKLARATTPAMIEVRPDIAADLPDIMGNSGQIHQALLNLITNAVHAIGNTPGRIDVSLQPFFPAQAAQNSNPPAPQLKLSVRDDGCGMDSHTRERIFDPFYTTRAPGEGAGLGLSIVHEVMRTHGGHIEVSSAPGAGSTFCLYFPVAEQAAGEVPVVAVRRATTPKRLRVLFLDDDPLVNAAIAQVLQRQGHTVTALRDPEKALDGYLARLEEFDVLVIDLAMPGMSGLDFVRTLRARAARIPVVLTSGNFSMADERLAQELGIEILLHKPYKLDTLQQALEEAVGTQPRLESAP